MNSFNVNNANWLPICSKTHPLAEVQDRKGTPFEYFQRVLSTNQRPEFRALDQSEASIFAWFLAFAKFLSIQCTVNWIHINDGSNGVSFYCQCKVNWIPIECHLNTNGMSLEYQWNSFDCQRNANWLPMVCHSNVTCMSMEWTSNAYWMPIECQLNANWMPVDCQSSVTGLPLECQLKAVEMPIDCQSSVTELPLE